MNTHDKIELPPLPQGEYRLSPDSLAPTLYDEEAMEAYARAAIEADRKRRGEPVAWGAFYFGGKRNGKLYSHTETEAQIDAYIADVHRSNDSITLRKGPLYTAPQPAESCASLISDKTACGSENEDCDSQPSESTFTTPDCPRCGCVQDGQCLCNPSRPSTEPVTVPSDDVLADALTNLEHDNYEQSYSGYKNRQADVELIRAALAAMGERK